MKNLYTLCLILVSWFSHSQNFYSFSTFQDTYSDLTNPVSINNNSVWDFDSFGPFNIPFDFSIGGVPVNRFMFDDDDFVLLTSDADIDEEVGIYFLYSSVIYIQDKTFDTGVSSSPISYKVEGTQGNRILKLEVKNAGLEDFESDFLVNNFFINYQIWLYESDNAIEFRYGNHNITDELIEVITQEDVVLTGFVGDDLAGLIYGDTSSPTYSEFDTEQEEPFISLSSFPNNGTVYRLVSSQLNTSDFEFSQFSIYPNPVSEQLYISSDSVIKNYVIYDLLGKQVISGNYDKSIDVSVLKSGVYVIKIGNTTERFIKK